MSCTCKISKLMVTSSIYLQLFKNCSRLSILCRFYLFISLPFSFHSLHFYFWLSFYIYTFLHSCILPFLHSFILTFFHYFNLTFFNFTFFFFFVFTAVVFIIWAVAVMVWSGSAAHPLKLDPPSVLEETTHGARKIILGKNRNASPTPTQLGE